MLCYVMLCYIKLQFVLSNHRISYHAMLCYEFLQDNIQNYVMLICYVVQCNVILLHLMRLCCTLFTFKLILF